MKIIDCFTFFNELDMLEFRLKLLDATVDRFVIAESNITHSGKPKPYYFEEHSQRFQPWLHKITYLPIVQSTEGLSFDQALTSYTPGSAAWKLENEQRNALFEAAKYAADDDLVLVSDLDEIPDPGKLAKIDLSNGPKALSMLFHYYFLNCQNTGYERWWNGSIVCTGSQFKVTTPQALRDKRNDWKRVAKGGWHFSYLGGLEKIKYKIQSFAHTEFNKDEYLRDENILKALEEGKDIFKRPGVVYKFVSTYYYPDFLRNVMLQYPALLYQKRKDSFLDKLYYSIKKMF
ncbi:MAG: hypothetical protein U0V75_01115 [Ferruginibacter sp.]